MELFRNDDGQGGIRPGGTQCRRGARGRSPRSPTLDWISTAPWSSSGTTTDREGFDPEARSAGGGRGGVAPAAQPSTGSRPHHGALPERRRTGRDSTRRHAVPEGGEGA